MDPATFVPLLKRVNSPANLDTTQRDYLTHRFSGFEAPGGYTILLGWTRPNAFVDHRIDEGDVLALDWKGLWFTGQPRPAPALVAGR